MTVLGLGALAYLIQIARMSHRKNARGLPLAFSWRSSALTVLTKFAELSGVLLYLSRLAKSARHDPIEYKEPESFTEKKRHSRS
jgi:hypothetical protein